MAAPDDEFDEKMDESSDEQLAAQHISPWAEEKPDENLEHPIPGSGEPDFYWCDVSSRTDNFPPRPQRDCRDKSLGYYREGTVKLPFAESDKIQFQSTRLRWELIKEAINSFANGVRDLDHLRCAISTYNKNYKTPSTLRRIVGDDPAEYKTVMDLLTRIARLANLSECICREALPTLPALVGNRPYKLLSVTMSQEQAGCLLAYGFFCCPFPTQSGFFNHFNFTDIHDERKHKSVEKMKFLLAYFEQITNCMPSGIISFSRQSWKGVLDERDWVSFHKVDKPLCPLIVRDQGAIEETVGCIHVDFANEFIGGGVLGHGTVQEEIMFLCCPELIISLLLCERLEKREAIIIRGAQRYSDYTGYGSTLRWAPYFGPREKRDCYGRARTTVCAIDAIRYESASFHHQFRPEEVQRETGKAYAGYRRMSPDSPKRPVATGNWGCGVFNGDKELKSLIQLVACSTAERPMVYYTFNDPALADGLRKVHQKLTEKCIDTGRLYAMILNFHESREIYLFRYILETLKDH